MGTKQLFEIELAKYHIDDLCKDLEDCWAKADHFAGELLKTNIVNTAIDLFCKWHRLHREKPKRLRAQLSRIDPIFPRLLETTLEAAYNHKETLLELIPGYSGFCGWPGLSPAKAASARDSWMDYPDE